MIKKVQEVSNTSWNTVQPSLKKKRRIPRRDLGDLTTTIFIT